MTEEIIIDGVNVAGCRYYEPKAQVMTCHEESITKRCNNIECYYKQFKRLQEKYDTLTNKFFNSETDKTRLEQENKELKEKKDKYYQQTLDDEILMNELSLEVDLRKKESDFYLEKLSNYRSALEEIRENLVKLKTNDEDDFTYEYSKIEDKINEVLQ